MIHQHKGDVLSIEEGIIVHGCNAMGRMGAGIAKQIKDRFPVAYSAYKTEERINGLRLGSITVARVADDKHIVNGITQETFGGDPNKVYVDYDAVRQVFRRVNMVAEETGLPVHFPMIGCGLANGHWETIARIIDEEISDEIGKHLWLFEPKGW